MRSLQRKRKEALILWGQSGSAARTRVPFQRILCGQVTIEVVSSEAVKKWVWLRTLLLFSSEIRLVVRCLTQFFHSLSVSELGQYRTPR